MGKIMRKIITAFVCFWVILAQLQTLVAGEYEKLAGSDAGTAGIYRFTDCIEPDIPEVPAGARLLRGEAIRQHNIHVDAVNIYFECLAAEAERDLNAHHKAVEAALVHRQNVLTRRLDDRLAVIEARSVRANRRGARGRSPDRPPEIDPDRRGLDLGPARPRSVDDQLLGGDDEDR